MSELEKDEIYLTKKGGSITVQNQTDVDVVIVIKAIKHE